MVFLHGCKRLSRDSSSAIGACRQCRRTQFRRRGSSHGGGLRRHAARALRCRHYRCCCYHQRHDNNWRRRLTDATKSPATEVVRPVRSQRCGGSGGQRRAGAGRQPDHRTRTRPARLLHLHRLRRVRRRNALRAPRGQRRRQLRRLLRCE